MFDRLTRLCLSSLAIDEEPHLAISDCSGHIGPNANLGEPQRQSHSITFQGLHCTQEESAKAKIVLLGWDVQSNIKKQR